MTILQRTALAAALLAAPMVHAKAVDTMAKQQQCSAIVKSNMSATARKNPAVLKTVKGYFFEYSPSRDTCVEILQYNIRKPGKPHRAQILAYNAVTQQLMEGYDHIFLEDAND